MRLRDHLAKHDPDIKKNSNKPQEKAPVKQSEPQEQKVERVEAKKKKEEIGTIFTQEFLMRVFESWKPNCKCDAELLFKKEKPGGNWTFYKECAACGYRSTPVYKTIFNVVEFLESDIGQFWK